MEKSNLPLLRCVVCGGETYVECTTKLGYSPACLKCERASAENPKKFLQFQRAAWESGRVVRRSVIKRMHIYFEGQYIPCEEWLNGTTSGGKSLATVKGCHPPITVEVFTASSTYLDEDACDQLHRVIDMQGAIARKMRKRQSKPGLIEKTIIMIAGIVTRS